MDTIYALSTAVGKAGVAVIRVSGPKAEQSIHALCARDLSPRQATVCNLFDPETKEALDHALVLWFPGPNSFTGEDVAEFHVHGSLAVVQDVLAVLADQPGFRLAGAGEFSRRAFENNKLDLTAVEGLADLIEAETSAQRKAAVRQMQGELATLYDDWANQLTRSLAYLEAEIDFADEELDKETLSQHKDLIRSTLGEIQAHLNDRHAGERLRTGFRVAVVGPPNVGKSSFINMLSKRDVAIVSDIAGTTRDVIEVHLDLGGYPVLVADTAGLRQTEDVIESEGIRRAAAWAEQADLTVFVTDTAHWPLEDNNLQKQAASADAILVNKIDLKEKNPDVSRETMPVFLVSVTEGTGLDKVLSFLTETVKTRLGESTAAPLITRARYREALQDVVSALQRSGQAELPELVAEDIRLAVRALGRITGRVDVEDLLDIIFADFCIGK